MAAACFSPLLSAYNEVGLRHGDSWEVRNLELLYFLYLIQRVIEWPLTRPCRFLAVLLCVVFLN